MEAVGWSVFVEKVGEVGGGLLMEGFVSGEKEFELNLSWDMEQMEVL